MKAMNSEKNNWIISGLLCFVLGFWLMVTVQLGVYYWDTKDLQLEDTL